MESDVLAVIKVLNGEEEDISELKPIAEDILRQSSRLKAVEFIRIFCRSENSLQRDIGHIFWAPDLPSLFLPLFYEGSCIMGG